MNGIDIGIGLIKKWEGCSLTAYQPLHGDRWTIGYGATGPGIVEGTTWTQQQAEDDLSRKVNDLAGHIHNATCVPLTSNQLGALISFSYNLGFGALLGSHLLAYLNMGKYEEAADQFPLWVHFQGMVIPGLVNRREDERTVFLTPDQ
jgi:lysozyme